jgi:sugar lactone lactonase YvrE
MRLSHPVFRGISASVSLLCGLLAGCSFTPGASPTADAGAAISGRTQGGQSPIVGAHVYLLAANTTGYGNLSNSLLTAGTGRTLDSSVGATNGFYYVTSDVNGAFSISGDYTCTANTQVYLYALGGNPGSGTNSGAGLMAALGNCPGSGNFATSTPYVFMNEVSTVAAAYAFAGFATDAVHVSSSGTTAAKAGLTNAFYNAGILETVGTGVANAFPPGSNMYYGGGGAVPQTTVNTLGNILAACVNSNGAVTGPSNPTACYTLFTNAMSGGTTGTQPTDTATAAINIAHNPVATVSALYTLSSAYAQFAPALTTQPNDFTLTIYYNAGTVGYGPIVADATGNIWWSDTVVDVVNGEGYDPTPSNMINGNTGYAVPYYPAAIALDTNGDLWSVNADNGNGAASLNELTPAGSTGTGSPFTALGITHPAGIAFDGSNNSWTTNTSSTASVIKASSAGALSGTFTGSGISAPQGIAIDPSGNAWVADSGNALIKLSNSGSPLSGAAGYTGIGLNNPKGVAIDHSGNVWVANSGGNNVIVVSSTGGSVSGAGGYTASTLTGAFSITMDGTGNAWIASINPTTLARTITELSNTGTVLSGPNGFITDATGGLAIDGSGDVWTNYEYANFPFSPLWYVTEMVGAASPVVTPVALGVKNNTLGARP